MVLLIGWRDSISTAREEVFSISRDHALGAQLYRTAGPARNCATARRDNMRAFQRHGQTRTGRRKQAGHETKMVDGKGLIFPVETGPCLARSERRTGFCDLHPRTSRQASKKSREIIGARDEALDCLSKGKTRFFAR